MARETTQQRSVKVKSIVVAREEEIRAAAVRLRKAAVRDTERLRSQGWKREDFIRTLCEDLGSNEVDAR